MDRPPPASSNLMDTHNRLVADVLTHFRALVMLATVQAEGERNNATPATMAVTAISLRIEFDGLYSSIKDLLALARRIKELWVFGPLGQADPDRRAREARLDADVARVAALVDALDVADMKDLAARHAGAWARLSDDGPDAPTGHGGP